MTRYLIVLLATVGLSACGFHLRNKLTLPDDVPAVKVESAVRYSELTKLLERGLRASGAVVVSEGDPPLAVAAVADASALQVQPEDGVAEPVQGVSPPADGAARIEGGIAEAPMLARLKVRSERWGELPIAIDNRGRAQEFSLRYAVIFSFLRPDGSALVPEQAIELSRDYISQPTDTTGTVTEREILADELRKEMSAAILRRIDSVVRAEMEKGHSLQADPMIEPAVDVESAEPASVDGN